MSFNKRASSRSALNKASTNEPARDASALLAAVKQADARARVKPTSKMTPTPPPTATPALSLSSSVTRESDTSLSSLSSQGFPSAQSQIHSRSLLATGFQSKADHARINEEETDPYVVQWGDDGLGVPTVPPTSEQHADARHTEFGHCWNEDYRRTSSQPADRRFAQAVEQEPPYYVAITTYISYMILIMVGHFRDFLMRRTSNAESRQLREHDGYAPIVSDFDSFYSRRLKTRIDDCFLSPVTGVAGRTIMLIDRTSPDHNKTWEFTGTQTRALNLASYNYLGFARAQGGCADVVEEAIKRYGIAACGSRLEGGSFDLHRQAEDLVADFVGAEDATIVSMGFATNSTIIPALVNKGCLVISDEFNHSSIRVGVRFSGANVRTFKHNDMKALEALLREVITQGQPRSHRPWKKILLIVEGLYSMEGTMVDLPAVLELKKKYKFYIYLDEAHSIGAMGPHGRGVCDYFGINPRDVDVLMGTFTKSFGAAGGYIAGAKSLISRLRLRGRAGPYAEAMAPAVLTQVIASMASIMGVVPVLPEDMSPGFGSRSNSSGPITPTSENTVAIRRRVPGPAPSTLLPTGLSLPPSLADGSEGLSRLRRLAFNARYLHAGLHKLGFITYGSLDSPIVPLLIYHPGKLPLFHRMMKQRKLPIVTVVVGYPACPLPTGRIRFCVSAAHTKYDVDEVLRASEEVGGILDLKHGLPKGKRWSLERVLASAEELVGMEE